MSTTIQSVEPAGASRQERSAATTDQAETTIAPGTDGKKANPARKVGRIVLLVIVASLVWHISSDLMAPSSSTGSVAAFTTQIAPRVGGQVATVHVGDNQKVAAGDPLFSLDAAPFELTLRQAEAAYAQALVANSAAVASLSSVDAQRAQAQSAFDSAKVSAARAQELFDKGLSSQAQLETALAQAASARAALDAVTAQLESASIQAGSDAAPSPQVLTAEIQLEQARLNREFTTILAPSDGVITNLKLAPGQYVNAGSPALTFIESELPWVVVDMRENQLINITTGDPARVVFDGAPGRTFEGRVRGIAWGIDPGRTAANGLPQNQSLTRWFEPARAIPVHIELVESEAWPENVRVGSKANALVFAHGTGNPVAWIAGGLQTIGSYLSYLY